MSCRHKNIMLVGGNETGLRAARCSNCRAPLTRRIEGGAYVYVRRDERDDAEATSQDGMSP